MSESSSDVNPLDALAEEFVARHRAGERPSLDEFIARRPDLADDIRDLFPGLVMMEGVRPDRGDSTGPFAPGPALTLKRLGDFRILREVGRGGMGVVYEAEQESLGRHVALKVLPAHALLEPQRLRRFQREAKAAARLHHTNIVPVYGVGEQDGIHYYVMQFIQGQGLDQVLDELKQIRRKRQGSQGDDSPRESPAARGAESAALSLLTGKFAPEAAAEDVPKAGAAAGDSPSMSPARTPESSGRSDTGSRYWSSVARVGAQTAQALAYAASQGTLHRDVKPSNLLLDAHGNLWVTDFGLAKAADSEDLTRTGDIVGTLRYMAPERFSGKGNLRSDLYSLGLTLHELLALRPAFEAPDRQQLVHQVLHAEPARLRQLDHAIPRDLETIVHKAIDRDPARRYQTAEEMADDLQRFLDDRPIRARRVGAVEKLWRWARRNPAVAALSAAVVLLLVGLAVGASAAAYFSSETAAREAKMADDERKAHFAADAARKAADYNAGRLRDSMDRLYEVNALMASGRQHLGVLVDWEAAHADLTRAVERMPEYALVWSERADLYYRLGLEEEALADLTRVFELKEPDEPELWLRYAGLRLQQGDVAGYRAVCARMQEKFGADDKDDPIWLSLACCLGPDAVPNLDAQARRLEQAVKAAGQSFPWTTTAVLAAVYYRAGRFDEAERRLNELGDPATWGDYDGDSLFLVMGALIEHRKGKDDLAERRFLQAADSRLETLNNTVESANQPWSLIEEQEGESLYREAAEAVRAAGSKEPPRAWLRRAESHTLIGRKDRAVADLTRALQHKPDDPGVLVWRAGLYADINQRDRCDADLARFAALRPPDAGLWGSACNIYTGHEDWDAAAKVACQALDILKPDQAVVLYKYLCPWPASLSRVAQSRPDDFDLRRGCARAYQQDFDKQSEAVQWATEALRIKPDDPDALRDRANWNGQLGRLQEAAADLDHLLKVRPPQKADDLLPLALLRAYLDDRDGYRDVCRRMVEQFGKDPKAAWVVADAVTLAPNDVVESVTGTLARPAEQDFAFSLTYARACLRHGKETDALQMLTSWQGTAPIWYHRVLALVYHRLGRPERARECMKEADEREPMFAASKSYPPALQNDPPFVLTVGVDPERVWVESLRFVLLRREAEAAINAPHRKEAEECLRSKQWKEAVDHLNALLTADPAFWPDLTARGVAYAALGQQEKADADFKKARDLNPPSPYFWWTRGRLYAQAGLLNRAADDYGFAFNRLSPDDKHPEAEVAGPRRELCTELTQNEPLLLGVVGMRPDDVEIRHDCARIMEQQGKWKQALAFLGEVVRLKPNDDGLRLEHCNLAAEHEQWADAAGDCRRPDELGGRPYPLLGYKAPLLVLQTGDADGYRRMCRSLQKGVDEHPVSSDLRMEFLWSCLFGPEAVADYGPLIKLAEEPGAVGDDYRQVQLAGLHYRAGHFQEAQRLFDLRQIDPANDIRLAVDGWFFRAMTAHRLGRTEDAKQWMDKAVGWMGDAQQAKLPPGTKMADLPWIYRLEMSLLRREAEAVLKEPAPKPDK